MTIQTYRFAEKWIDAPQASFTESVDEDGKKKFMLEAMIVPFGETSRNKVKYNKESVVKTHKKLEGKPLMFNHVTNGSDVYARGEWEQTWCSDEGMHGIARVYNTEYNNDLLEYLKEASSPRVSLQITGNAEQRQDKDNNSYREAYIEDWLEASIVNVPGFDTARASFTAAIAEAFDSSKKSSNESLSAEFPVSGFIKGLDHEGKEHPNFKPCDVARIVIDHLQDDYGYYDEDDSEDRVVTYPTENKNDGDSMKEAKFKKGDTYVLQKDDVKGSPYKKGMKFTIKDITSDGVIIQDPIVPFPTKIYKKDVNDLIKISKKESISNDSMKEAKIRRGDKVKIDPQLTTDPKNKQGEVGKVVLIDSDGTIHVKFKDGTKGKYSDETTMKKVKESFEEDYSVGDFLKYKDGNDAGEVKEVTKLGYIVKPKDGNDLFFVAKDDTEKGAPGKDKSDKKESFFEQLDKVRTEAMMKKVAAKVDELQKKGLKEDEIAKQIAKDFNVSVDEVKKMLK